MARLLKKTDQGPEIKQVQTLPRDIRDIACLMPNTRHRELLCVSLGAFFLVVMVGGLGCSSSTTPTPAISPKDGTAGEGGAEALIKDCQIPPQRPFDATHLCFRDLQPISGLCITRPPPPNSTGLESVCAVDPNGHLFLIATTTDGQLSGTGWAFGARAAPDVSKNSDTLSPADEQRCTQAQRASGSSLSATSVCSDADAGAPDATSG